jgi:hypothetical protein
MSGRRRRHPFRLFRFANPLVRAVLRSPLHRLLSGRLLVLSYRGRRSGRTFEIPVRYAETDDGKLVVVATWPERKLWWRSFDGGAAASVTLRCARRSVAGCVESGEARDTALSAYLGAFPRSERLVREAAVVVLVASR